MGKVGLTMAEINALEIRENKSITEEFIKYVKASDLNFPVVLLKNSL